MRATKKIGQIIRAAFNRGMVDPGHERVDAELERAKLLGPKYKTYEQQATSEESIQELPGGGLEQRGSAGVDPNRTSSGDGGH